MIRQINFQHLSNNKNPISRKDDLDYCCHLVREALLKGYKVRIEYTDNSQTEFNYD